MKIKHIISLFSAVSILALGGCDNEVEDIFGESADARLGKKVQECQQTLTSSTFGWRLAYEPNPSLCARFFMKFGQENVEMKSDFTPQTSNSSYTFNYGQGPVLNFETYGLLHILADPDKSPTGTGSGGDFEFIIMDVKADSVFLKGKKNQNRLVLVKAAEGDEEFYFENGKRLKEALTKTSSSPYFTSITYPDGTGCVLTPVKNNRYLKLFIPKEGAIEQKIVSYDFDGRGFSLDEEVKIENKTIRFFDWDNDAAIFKTREGGGVIGLSHTTPSPLGKTVEKYSGKTLSIKAYSPLINVMVTKLKTTFPDLEIDLALNVNGASYWNFVTAHADGVNNHYNIASIEKLRDDQMRLIDATTFSGPSTAKLGRNPNFKNLMTQLNAEGGFTVYEQDESTYLINRTDSRYWIELKQK